MTVLKPKKSGTQERQEGPQYDHQALTFSAISLLTHSASMLVSGIYSGAFSSCSRWSATHRVHTVCRGDKSRRTIRISVEVLVDRIWWNINHVPSLPLELLDLVLRLPVIGIGNLDITVLMEIVAVSLEYIEAPRRGVCVTRNGCQEE